MQRQVPLAMTAANGNIAGQESLINCFAQKTQGGKYAFTIKSTEGLVSHTVLPASTGVKALHQVGDRGFAITSDGFYEILDTGSYVIRGAPVLTGTRVVADDNGAVIVMVDGLRGYSYDLVTNILTEITDPAFYPASTVTYQDGYFIFDRRGTRQFFITGVLDVTFDPLEIASANGSPDNLVAVLSDHRELILFCETTIEFWYNSGSLDFPFQRSEGSFIERGCGAKYSPAKMDNMVFFVGNDKNVYVLQGYQDTMISTKPVSDDLQNVNLNDTFGFTYTDGENKFYQLTIPARQKTWVYNLGTGAWFQRASNVFNRHVANCSINFNNKILAGDFQAGVVYEMTYATNTDDGEPLLKRFVLPVISIGRERKSIWSFELDMGAGVGLANGLSSDPRASLRVSKDNAKTWSSSMSAKIGKIGAYSTRVKWNKLGLGRQFTLEVTITADIDLDIGGAYVEVS